MIDSLSSPPVLWLGGYDGLYRFSYTENLTRYYAHSKADSNTLINDNILFLHGEYNLNKLILWIGTENGLDKFDVAQNKFTHFLYVPDDPHSLSNNSVYCIYRDTSGRLWLGTIGGGLNLLNERSNTFCSYTQEDGLVNNSVIGIIEDDKNNLWISTYAGLSKFNPQTKQFKNYDDKDGLENYEFWNWSFLKSHTGRMYFGGNNGVIYFHPDSIIENPNIPNIVLTDLQVFNQSVMPGEKSPLLRTISAATEITLPYDQDIFSDRIFRLRLYRTDEKFVCL